MKQAARDQQQGSGTGAGVRAVQDKQGQCRCGARAPGSVWCFPLFRDRKDF